MHKHTLFLVAYLVFPTIAAPVLPNEINPVFPTVDRRNVLPVTSVISSILERMPVVEKTSQLFGRGSRVTHGSRKDIESTEEKIERSIRVRPGGRDVEPVEEKVERGIRVRPGGRDIESIEEKVVKLGIRVRPGGRDVEPIEEKVERGIRVRPGGRDIESTEEKVVERGIRVRPGGRDIGPTEEKAERSIRVRPGGRRDVELTDENVKGGK
ncbi:hypothetical protein PTMSG1_00089 [Pyrenophora teres f. maculata]|nr:hypothetical protein PTMSG1_00089 [Pyrenophora teres f. maculata]